MAVKNKTKVIDLTQGVRDKMVIEGNALKLLTESSSEKDMLGVMSKNIDKGFTLSRSNTANYSSLYRYFDGDSDSASYTVQGSGYVTTVYLSLVSSQSDWKGWFKVESATPKIITRWFIYNGKGVAKLGPSGFSIYGYRADTGEKTLLVSNHVSGWTSSTENQVTVAEIPLEKQIPCTSWIMEDINNEHATSYTVRASEFTIYEKVPAYTALGTYTSSIIDLGEQAKQITSVSLSGTYTSNISTTVAYSNDGVTFDAFGAPTAGKGRYAIVKATMARYTDIETPTLTSMTLNYQVEDRYLIKDGSDYKSYTAGAWNSLGATIDRALLIAQGMTDLSVIPKASWQSLSAPEIICLSEEVNAVRSSRVTGVKKPVLITTVSDIDVKILKRLTTTSQETNSGILRILLSTDSGLTWQGKKVVNAQNNADIEANGFSNAEFNALTDAQWKSLTSTGKLRFGFYMNRMATTDFASFQSLSRENYSYDAAPTATTGKIDYKTTTKTVPDFYVSRDDGVTWKKVALDEMTRLKDLPVGRNVRVKIDLKNGQVLQALAYSWN